MSQSIKQITDLKNKLPDHGENCACILCEWKPTIFESLQAIRAETLDEVENLDLMKEEKLIALPVMQIQEQNNYDKEQRNELRAWLRKELSGLRNGLSTTHGNPENPSKGENTK